MNAANAEYNAVKSDLHESEMKLNQLIEENKTLEFENEKSENEFKSRINQLSIVHDDKIINFQIELQKLSTQLTKKQTELSALVEPTTEKLPEQIEISEELKCAHAEFERIDEEIIGAKAINANNKKLIAERTSEIKKKQENLIEIIEKITQLTAEISDYFSNLDGVVKEEFAGEIELSVELLEYVMSRDEYKDCFKITANGKVFPYECNGALQNNVKMQVLANLQRLKGYAGVTVMDNCEANTTQPSNTCGLNCVLAFATNDNELIIK